MLDDEPLALYQGFMPERGQASFVWKYATSTGGRRPRHFHAEPEVNVVVDGSATFAVGERVVQVTRGELLAFPAGQDHALLEASTNLYLFAIGLEAGHSARVLGSGQQSLVPLHVRLAGKELDGVLTRSADIVDRLGAEQLGMELWERVHWLGQHAAERVARGVHVLTRRTLELVAREPVLGLDALAAELRSQPSEISRYFHRDMGMTLVRYRTRQRLLRFIQVVDRGQRDFMAAALEAGFGSYSQCHRAFHAELRCAPKRFFAAVRERMQLTYAS